jgi:hypothetical protein
MESVHVQEAANTPHSDVNTMRNNPSLLRHVLLSWRLVFCAVHTSVTSHHDGKLT